MARQRKTLDRVLRGKSDANIHFADLRRLLVSLVFDERIRGGHYIYTRAEVIEIVNLQPKGAMAKPYQVKRSGRSSFAMVWEAIDEIRSDHILV